MSIPADIRTYRYRLVVRAFNGAPITGLGAIDSPMDTVVGTYMWSARWKGSVEKLPDKDAEDKMVRYIFDRLLKNTAFRLNVVQDALGYSNSQVKASTEIQNLVKSTAATDVFDDYKLGDSYMALKTRILATAPVDSGYKRQIVTEILAGSDDPEINNASVIEAEVNSASWEGVHKFDKSSKEYADFKQQIWSEALVPRVTSEYRRYVVASAFAGADMSNPEVQRLAEEEVNSDLWRSHMQSRFSDGLEYDTFRAELRSEAEGRASHSLVYMLGGAASASVALWRLYPSFSIEELAAAAAGGAIAGLFVYREFFKHTLFPSAPASDAIVNSPYEKNRYYAYAAAAAASAAAVGSTMYRSETPSVYQYGSFALAGAIGGWLAFRFVEQNYDLALALHGVAYDLFMPLVAPETADALYRIPTATIFATLATAASMVINVALGGFDEVFDAIGHVLMAFPGAFISYELVDNVVKASPDESALSRTLASASNDIVSTLEVLLPTGMSGMLDMLRPSGGKLAMSTKILMSAAAITAFDVWSDVPIFTAGALVGIAAGSLALTWVTGCIEAIYESNGDISAAYSYTTDFIYGPGGLTDTIVSFVTATIKLIACAAFSVATLGIFGSVCGGTPATAKEFATETMPASTQFGSENRHGTTTVNKDGLAG